MTKRPYNPVATWWHVTWNRPPDDWRDWLVRGGYVDKRKKGRNDEMRRNRSRQFAMPRVVQLMAAMEVSAAGKPHVHAVVQFAQPVCRSDMFVFYNTNAFPKALQREHAGHPGHWDTVSYILKGKPAVGDILFYPSQAHWFASDETVRGYILDENIREFIRL